VILAAARAIGGGARPVWEGVRAILDVESQWSVRSTWFVLCGTPTLTTMKAGDLTYRLESPAGRRIASALAGAGHEIGLHGSFETYASADRFREQRERLSHVIRQSPDGVRQHYLRMIPGETQSAMAAAGFCYDSTFGFADRNGFRLGVADVLPAWRATTPAAVAIEEVPFIWMDRALSKYRNIESPRSWVDDALELAAACQAVEGLWTGVWHPNLTPALGFPGAPDAFRMLVRELVQASPFVGTMSVLVRWRRARRTARAIASHADGSFAVECVDAGPFPLAIEDAAGRATPDAVRPAS